MPSIVKKVLVIAAVDGLILQPLRQQKPTSSVQIKYATLDIRTVPVEDIRGSASLEVHGIIGLLRVASSSFLVALTSREQVAQIRGRSVYTITGVSLIPLASQAEARKAIELGSQTAKPSAKAQKITEQQGDATDDELIHSGNVTAEDDAAGNLSSNEDNEHAAKVASTRATFSSIAQDVIRDKGQYGRFAERWFSRKGWKTDKRRISVSLQDEESGGKLDSSRPPGKVKDVAGDKKKQGTIDAQEDDGVATSLLPKLLRTTKMLLSSRSFFFSYDYDLTHRIGDGIEVNNDTTLHKLVDPLFFWNRALSKPLIDAGQHGFVLPIMQGFVGQKAFTVDHNSKNVRSSISDVKEDMGEIIELQETAKEGQLSGSNDKESQDFLITLISRRSVKRAGLRYLRRGVDEDGHVANAVETEQILSDTTWGSTFGVHSFTQIRGSVPLFFSQSPYSFKPTPTVQHSYEVNHRAFQKHFAHLRKRYGKVHIATLVEKRGPEANVGNAYSDHVEKLNAELPQDAFKIGYEWFDFHKMCAGMKFENVSILMDLLKSTLQGSGFSLEKNGKLETRQFGVLRTNCMDCLDRTNVVQSAAGAWALQAQLAIEHIDLNLESDRSTHWFNSLWADNGDAISKQYSSTAALKGDYTRTRKRDYRGAINDFGLTLTRYYNNIVNDYFSQTVIDYLLGNVTERVFEEFEDSMMTADPSVSMRTVRQNAIDTSTKIVIEDANEELTGGWTMLTPSTANTLRTLPLREVVLLLTDIALYAVRFDWNTEKVASFERIDLRSISHVRHGTYITNTFTASQLDPQRNVGLVLIYRPAAQNLVRHNTRSMSTMEVPRLNASTLPEGEVAGTGTGEPAHSSPALPPASRPPLVPTIANPTTAVNTDTELKLLAFKALPARSSLAASAHRDDVGSSPVNEKELVAEICDHLARLASQGDSAWLEEVDIISVQEAKRSTGLLETLGHSLKKMVWA